MVVSFPIDLDGHTSSLFNAEDEEVIVAPLNKVLNLVFVDSCA